MINDEFFKTLDSMISVSSREKQVREFLKKISKENNYEMVFDQLGSSFIHIPCGKEDAKKVMISFPMDESGYMVSDIHKDGSVSIVGVSNQTSVNLLGKAMIVETRSGQQLVGYTVFEQDLKDSTKHELSVKEEECKVCFGFTSKESVAEAGIRIGDPVVIKGDFDHIGSMLIGRGMDVRIGLWTTQQLIHAVKDKTLDIDLYVGGVVQEKVAYRGAVSSTTSIQPDINISLAFETISKEYTLGSGVFIKSFDKTTLPNRWMYDFISKNTTVHPYISNHGTSASFIHKSLTGVPSVVLGIHGQNIGLNTMLFHQQDIEDLSVQLSAIISQLTKQDIQHFQGSDCNE